MASSENPIPLWRQLQSVATLLQAVREGQSLSALMGTVDAALRPGVQSLIFHVLRNLGRAQALAQRLASREPAPQVEALLCTALALAWRESDAPYAPFTLVDQAVEAAKRQRATRASANFLNACLRRFLRERDALARSTDGDLVAAWNHPRWWIERLRSEYPDRWQEILRANNLHAPLTLRVNRQKSTRDTYLHELQQQGIGAKPVGADGVMLDAPRPLSQVPGFAEGVVSVQDAAAQMAAPLLLQGMDGVDRERPLRVLDACAAPGGKTAHLLEYLDCRVTALDVDAVRCERIHENLQRLGLTAQVICADAARPADWWESQCGGEQFDAILLDAPCTASGIVRRHPDVRWLRREADVSQMAALQQSMLVALWPLLKPGGRLLYCTCSVFRAEGMEGVQTFVAHNTEAVLRPSPGQLVPHFGANRGAVPDNLEGDHDGFFLALLEKSVA